MSMLQTQTRSKASRTQRDPEKITMSETVEAWAAKEWVLSKFQNILDECRRLSLHWLSWSIPIRL